MEESLSVRFLESNKASALLVTFRISIVAPIVKVIPRLLLSMEL